MRSIHHKCTHHHAPVREAMFLEVHQPRDNLGKVLAGLLGREARHGLGDKGEELPTVGIGHDEVEAVAAGVDEAVDQRDHVWVRRGAPEDGEGLDLPQWPAAGLLGVKGVDPGNVDALCVG